MAGTPLRLGFPDALMFLKADARSHPKNAQEISKNKERKAAANQMGDFADDSQNFEKIDGVTSRIDPDLQIINVELNARARAYQRPKRQAGHIPTCVLVKWDHIA